MTIRAQLDVLRSAPRTKHFITLPKSVPISKAPADLRVDSAPVLAGYCRTVHLLL